jgi:hypothetical protein
VVRVRSSAVPNRFIKVVCPEIYRLPGSLYITEPRSPRGCAMGGRKVRRNRRGRSCSINRPMPQAAVMLAVGVG